MVLYNDNDPKVCAWLRELVAQGHLPAGAVLEKSVNALTADDLAPYDTVHLFAGIGGWPLALRLAGWPDDVPVWTGSCPCQPFSCAGRGGGTSDPRHLWPVMRDLIALRHPPVVFGEQVASKAGREWLAGVRADLEALGYAVGASDLCAAGEGAPHIRQRLYWVAVSESNRLARQQAAWNGRASAAYDCNDSSEPYEPIYTFSESGCRLGGVAHRLSLRLEEWAGESRDTGAQCTTTERGGDAGRMEQPSLDGRQQRGTESSRGSAEPRCEFGGMANSERNDGRTDESGRGQERRATDGGISGMDDALRDGHDNRPQLHREHDGQVVVEGCLVSGLDNPTSPRPSQAGIGADLRIKQGGERGSESGCSSGHWSSFDLLPCLDSKTRRIEPGSFPLAHGVPARVGRLRGYGNAIVPQVAATFIRAFCEAVS